MWFTVVAQADVVQWTAPSSCPDDAAVEARIAELVDVSAAITPTLAVVSVHEGGFEVELTSTIDGETQRRTLTAPTCETVAEAAAAVIAVTIDPIAEPAADPVGEPPADDPASETASPVGVAPTVDRTQPDATRNTTARGVADEPTRRSTRRRPLEIGLHVQAGYGSAIAPRGSAVLGAGLSVGRRPWSLEAEARVWTPRTFDAADESFGARVTMGTAMVVGCLRPPSDRIEVPLCLGIEGGGERVAPNRLSDGRQRAYPWLAPLFRVGLRVRLNPFLGLVVRAEAAVPAFRAGILIDDFGVLWQTQSVSARVLAGLDFRWIR